MLILSPAYEFGNPIIVSVDSLIISRFMYSIAVLTPPKTH